MALKRSITTAEFEQRYEALPDEVASVYESERTGRMLFEIGKANGVPIDKMGEISQELGYLLLGVAPASAFVTDLSDIIGDRETARRVALEINNTILFPVREALQQTHGGWQDDLGVDGTPPAPKVLPPPIAPPPTVPVPSQGPEPLIIMPLRGRTTPLPAAAPIRGPELPPTAKPRPQQPPHAAQETPEGKSPLMITPLGTGPRDQETRPVAPPAPPATPAKPGLAPPEEYLRVKQRFEEDLRQFEAKQESPQAAAAPRAPAAPGSTAPPGSRLEGITPRAGGQPGTPHPQPPVAPQPAPQPAPLKLPPTKIPKPEAPERYAIDPYKEPVE